MRYFAELRYDGAAYCGWQRQPDAPSVQETLERALSALLRAPVETVGAGRTDTGVNASYYVAHFDCAEPVADRSNFLYRLNRILPADISVSSITPVSDEAHARFSAVEREYVYCIVRSKNPFCRRYAWHYDGHLDVEAMNEAAAMLKQFDDFTSFAKLNSANKTNICRILRSEWSLDGDMLRYTIRADRFLRNMVRAIVGTLVDVGRGRYSPAEFREIVASRDLSRSGGSAPAQGLFLHDIKYPEEIFSPERIG